MQLSWHLSELSINGTEQAQFVRIWWHLNAKECAYIYYSSVIQGINFTND